MRLDGASSFDIRHSLAYSTDRDDFVCVHASVGNLQLCDPDQIAVCEAVEVAVADLLNNLRMQNSLPGSFCDELGNRNASEAYGALCSWQFRDGPSPFPLLDDDVLPQYFTAIPDGPEPFLGHMSYAILEQECHRYRLLIQRPDTKQVYETQVAVSDYVSAWENLHQSLSAIRFERQKQQYQTVQEIHGETVCYSIDGTEVENKKNYAHRKAIAAALFSYLATRSLLGGEATERARQGTLERVRYADLNELGWLLKNVTLDRWINSKSARMTPPDISPLDDDLNRLRQANPYLSGLGSNLTSKTCYGSEPQAREWYVGPNGNLQP